MTDPNVLFGNGGMKFIFSDTDTQMVHLMRPTDGENFDSAVLSLCTPNAESGTTYQVPSGKSYYMLSCIVTCQDATDLKIVIQKNTVADTIDTATGDNMYNFYFASESTTGYQNLRNLDLGGLKFDALDYVTPFLINLPANARWGFSCYGVECDA